MPTKSGTSKRNTTFDHPQHWSLTFPFEVGRQSWCYEMRVMEAFAWILFALCGSFLLLRTANTISPALTVVIFLWILITLTSRAQAMGRPYAWSEPIFELGWFGQYPGMPESMYGPHIPGSPSEGGTPYMGGGYPYGGSPGMYPQQMMQMPM